MGHGSLSHQAAAQRKRSSRSASTDDSKLALYGHS
jgi:hypothetical protein